MQESEVAREAPPAMPRFWRLVRREKRGESGNDARKTQDAFASACVTDRAGATSIVFLIVIPAKVGIQADDSVPLSLAARDRIALMLLIVIPANAAIQEGCAFGIAFPAWGFEHRGD